MIRLQNTIFYNFSQMFFLFWNNSTALALELCLNCRTNLGYPYQSVHFFGTKSLILCAGSLRLVEVAKKNGMTGIGVKQNGPPGKRFFHLDNLGSNYTKLTGGHGPGCGVMLR